VDGHAKGNSKRVAGRSSHLLQAELVQIGEWLICVAVAEGFAAADYQTADTKLLNSSSPVTLFDHVSVRIQNSDLSVLQYIVARYPNSLHEAPWEICN
jgi:hypothetical protein